MSYGKSEGISSFAKIMIGIALTLVAAVVIVVVTMGGQGGSSTLTPKNFINNAMQFHKGGELQTAAAVELEALKPTQEEPAEGDVILTLFADYACPHCQTFDAETAGPIDEMLEEGILTELRVAPVSYQPVPYSGTAHMTMLCLADHEPTKTYKAHTALMEIGAEGGADFSTLMSKIGEATGGELTDTTKLCVKNNTYRNFADQQNEAAQLGGFWPTQENLGITGTPTIFINDQKYTAQPDAETLATAIAWVKAGGTLADLETDPELIQNLDMTDPKNPVIKE